MTFLESTIFCLASVILSTLCLAGYILAFKISSIARWIFISGFAFFLTASIFFVYQRVEPTNLVRNYMGISLSDDTSIRRFHADFLARDPGYVMHLLLARSDISEFVAFFQDKENRMDGATERLPSSWSQPKGITKKYIRNKGSVWFHLDINETTGEAWLSIQTT